MSGNKDKGNKDYDKAKGKARSSSQAAKRTCDDLSDTSMEEITILTHQVDNVHKEVRDIKKALKDLLKKEDIQALIQETVKTTVKELEQNLERSIERKIKERSVELSDRLDSLVYENCELKEKIEQRDRQIQEFEDRIKKAEELSKASMKKANYNEQYSRKNNIKIMGLVEKPSETNETLKRDVCSFLEVKANVSLRSEQIIAIHRIPGKIDQPKPVLVKMRNNNDKSVVMRQRTKIKEAGYRLVDDVTKANSGLIARLMQHRQMESAWYFNGSIYGRTKAGKRHRFDMYDNIDSVISVQGSQDNTSSQMDI